MRPARSGTVFVKTPYNFDYGDIPQPRAVRHLTAALTAVKRGYAYVVQNERGHFFSEGNYDVLGRRAPTGMMHSSGSRSRPGGQGKVGATRYSLTAG